MLEKVFNDDDAARMAWDFTTKSNRATWDEKIEPVTWDRGHGDPDYIPFLQLAMAAPSVVYLILRDTDFGTEYDWKRDLLRKSIAAVRLQQQGFDQFLAFARHNRLDSSQYVLGKKFVLAADMDIVDERRTLYFSDRFDIVSRPSWDSIIQERFVPIVYYPVKTHRNWSPSAVLNHKTIMRGLTDRASIQLMMLQGEKNPQERATSAQVVVANVDDPEDGGLFDLPQASAKRGVAYMRWLDKMTELIGPVDHDDGDGIMPFIIGDMDMMAGFPWPHILYTKDDTPKKERQIAWHIAKEVMKYRP